MCGVDCTVCRQRVAQGCRFTGYGDDGVCAYDKAPCEDCRKKESHPEPAPQSSTECVYVLTEVCGEYSDKSFDVLCASTDPNPVVDTMICHLLGCNKLDLDRKVVAILEKVSKQESIATPKDQAIQHIVGSSLRYEIFRLPLLPQDPEHHLNVGCDERDISLNFNRNADKFEVTTYHDKSNIESPVLDILNESFHRHVAIS